jgi:hypothetical protein
MEGGVRAIDGAAPVEPKKRVRTQERDEQFRRSRLKQDERKRKMDFTYKMSKKVKFSDILQPASAKIDAEDATDESPIKRQHIPNTLPVVDRLKILVGKSMLSSEASEIKPRKVERQHADKRSSDNDHKNDSSMAEEVNEIVDNPSYELSFALQATANTVPDLEVVENDVAYDSDQDSVVNSAIKSNLVNPCYTWFFDKIHDQKELQPVKSSVAIKEGITGALSISSHPQLPSITTNSITTVQQIPGLHKLWKYRSQHVPLNVFSQQLFPHLLTYSDVYLEGRDAHNDAMLLETLLMHSIFHVVKSRAKVVKHNQRLKKRQQEQVLKAATAKLQKSGGRGKKDKKVNESQPEDDIGHVADVGSERKARPSRQVIPGDRAEADEQSEHNMRDQGFTRPRLLILCPFRSSAKRIVHSLMSILGENTSAANMDKFAMEYADPEPDSDDEINMTNATKKKRSKDQAKGKGPTEKPWDWQQTFQGNVDDDFKLGIQVNPGHGKGQGDEKGVFLRMFSDFFISDIIVASPLGLKLIMDRDDDMNDAINHDQDSSKTKNKYKPNGPNADFLSSIEQVIIHQADVLYLQNWEHVNYILSNLNQLPSEPHPDTDYSRIRAYFLDKQGHQHRQLMLTTYFNHPEILSTFRRYGFSQAGQVKAKKTWDHANGAGDILSQVAVPVKQIFQMLPLSHTNHQQVLLQYDDMKFQYFVENILTPILQKKQKRILIVAPSYFDYVRIRNYLMQQEVRKNATSLVRAIGQIALNITCDVSSHARQADASPVRMSVRTTCSLSRCSLLSLNCCSDSMLCVLYEVGKLRVCM